jgi:hypothetical protein
MILLRHRAALSLLAGALAIVGCKRKGGEGLVERTETGPPPSAERLVAPSSAPAAPVASDSPPLAPTAGEKPPTGGVAEWALLDSVKECNVKGRDLEPNLAYGGIGIGARGKELAVAFQYSTKIKGEGLVAFAGYDSLARTLGVAHGLGKSTFVPPVVFPRKDAFVVGWFDAQGFVYTNATWAPTMPKTERLVALGKDEAGHTAMVMTKDGGVLAASPIAPGATEQVGLFLFPSIDDLSQVKALGATHKATNPQHATVVEEADGYLVAWEDEPVAGRRVIALSRFDQGGKELGAHRVLSSEGRAASYPTLARVDGGALLAWSETDGTVSSLVVRSLDATGVPKGPAARVDLGQKPTLTSLEKDAALTFLRGPVGDRPAHIALVRVAASGAPAQKGLIVSEMGKGKGAVADSAGIATTADGRLAFVFAYVEGMKGAMRTAKIAGCF